MATNTQADILPPRYRSIEPLAHGGMGEIYRATDDALGRDVAVKVLAERFARDEASRARFTREALAAARLSGEPFIVTIFDVGEWREQPYIVMELAAGGTVAQRLERGHVSTADALRWLEQAGLALDAAHARGIVHRDVKPANLLLTRDGDVRVADFGIASAAGLASLTATGTVLGTMGYLAPEQAMGRETTAAADRYALAVVAYELLAGRRPFQGEGTGPAEAAAAAREPAPTISHERPDLPPTLDPVFRRALAKEPGVRHPTCAELVGELRRAFEDEAGATTAWPTAVVTRTTEVKHAPTAGRVRRRRSSRALPLVLAVLALGVAGLLAALLLDRGDGTKQANPPAARTVTARGETVTVTTPTTAPATEPTTAPSSGGESGSALNDAAWTKIQAGDFAGARPLLEQAVAKLQGTGSLAEAYALYNLALTRFALGDCDGVAALLDRSEAIQGKRKEIDKLRKDAGKSCGGGPGPNKAPKEKKGR
jgi:hypothetical protein